MLAVGSGGVRNFLQGSSKIYLFSCTNITVICYKLKDNVINYFILKELI